ncbi:MAG: methyl-accepting chemotaxis protein, partial [Pseudomonadota bacterium]
MSNLKLGAKISLGFGLLILLVLALGGMASYNNAGVSHAVQGDREFLEALNTVGDVQERFQRGLFNMRGYTMSFEQRFLDLANADLAKARKGLDQVKALGAKGGDFVKLAAGVDGILAALAKYEEQISQTESRHRAEQQNREVMNAEAAKFLKNANAYAGNQEETFNREMAEGLSADKIKERFRKTVLLNDLIDLGNNVRVANFKAQATDDHNLIKEALPSFEAMDKRLEEIRPLTHQAANQRQLDEIKAAAEGYKSAMTAMLGHMIAFQDIRKTRQAAADQCLAMISSVQEAAFKAMDQSQQSTQGTVRSASLVMYLGMAVALALGLILAFFITRSITRPIHAVIAGLSDGAGQVASASGQVATSSQSLAEGASQQAAALEETSSSLEEMSSMTKTNADNAAQANSLMSEAKTLVARANQSMGELTQSM